MRIRTCDYTVIDENQLTFLPGILYCRKSDNTESSRYERSANQLEKGTKQSNYNIGFHYKLWSACQLA